MAASIYCNLTQLISGPDQHPPVGPIEYLTWFKFIMQRLGAVYWEAITPRYVSYFIFTTKTIIWTFRFLIWLDIKKWDKLFERTLIPIEESTQPDIQSGVSCAWTHLPGDGWRRKEEQVKLRFSDEKESSGRFLFNRKREKRRLLHTTG